MNYLDSNLVTLNTNLLRANFDRILDSIWVEVLEEMMEVLVTEEVVSHTTNLNVVHCMNPSDELDTGSQDYRTLFILASWLIS